MLAWIKSFFNEVPVVDSIINLHLVDDREDEDVITHDRVFVPCPVCKRSMVITYTHAH